MRVLFTSLRSTSHFLPLVPFIEACLHRGHEVAVAAPVELAARVASTGAKFLPFAHPGDAVLQPLWASIPQSSPDEAKRIVIGEIFAGVNAAAALPDLRKTVDAWHPDVLVRESQEYAAPVVAEQTGTACARVAITLNRAEAEVSKIAATAVDKHRVALGLPPGLAGERFSREPVLTLLPPSLAFPNDPGAAHVRRFHTARVKPAPLPAWWDGQSGPLLYVTFGTVAGGMEKARAIYRTALDAVSDLAVRVLLTIGSELPEDALGVLPAHVHVERFVPQNDVLPYAATVLCHGGSGTVLGALAAGVPLVVTPMFADQPDNAERVVATGAGLALSGPSRSVPELRKAVKRVIEEPSFRLAAGRFSEEIAALPSVDEAAAEIERIARG